MTSIPVTTEINIDVDKLCFAMDIKDVVSLISYAANHYAEKKPVDIFERRVLITQIEDSLSDNGRRLIGELAGCIYGRRAGGA